MKTADQWMNQEFVVLYSDKQDAYHIETEDEYWRKGPANGNWRIVERAAGWMAATEVVKRRVRDGSDKPCR